MTTLLFCPCRSVIITFLMFGVIALLISSLVIRFTVYGSKSRVMAPRDQVPISVSSYFCESVQLEDRDAEGFVYLYVLPHPPPLTVWEAFNITQNEISIAPGDYQYWSYYMNAGSQVNVSVCAQPSIDLYVFKGESNFDDWKKDDSYSTFFHAYYRGSCSNNGRNGFNSLQMKSRDDYYFVFEADGSGRRDLDLTLSFNRSLYNLSGVSGTSCWANQKCSLSLDYASSNFVLIVANNSLQSDENVNIRWSCGPRNWFYGAVFGTLSVALFVIAVVAALCWCYGPPKCRCKCCHKRKGERRGLLTSRSPHHEIQKGSTSIVTTTTTVADSLVDDEPPGYEEAAAM